jgi:polysaccharide export outer membrane protein
VPIEGAVSLEGLTLAEAETRLRQIFNQYVVIRELNPQYAGPPDVTLTLTAQRGVEVTIVGDVQRPGFYPLPDSRVVTALLTAGGSTNTADLRNIRIERRLRDGSSIEETVDLFTPLKEGRALPDIRLENGDVLHIPRLEDSDWVDYDRYLVARSTLARPVITVRFINYAAGFGGGLGSSGNLGAVQVPNGTSLVDAVTLIGVNPDLAQLNQVAIYRFSPESGRPVQMLVDAIQGFNGNPAQNPPLEHNDVIVVGRNFISRVNYALNVITQPFTDILGFLFFLDSVGSVLD